MNIDYKINEFPKDTKSYNVPAYTEGSIKVIVGNDVIVEINDVLIVEFSIVLRKWVKRINNQESKENLYYASMNFEEEPIIEFRYSDKNQIIINSVFMKGEAAVCTLDEVINGVNKYLSDLASEVKSKFNFDLNQRIEEELSKSEN